MKGLLRTRLEMGRQTIGWPDAPASFPERFRGRPALQPGRCPPGCASCVTACPTAAITSVANAPVLDTGACLFCGLCQEACPEEAIVFTRDHRLSARTREALVVHGDAPVRAPPLDDRLQRLLGRSLKLRQVSAGGCNGCEAELNAAGNVQFDLSRFGIQFVASPRHADGLVVTGPVTAHMRSALLDTWAAIPAPRIAVAVGACAIAGGPFRGSPEALGIPEEIPIDLFVPGCPPHPVTFIDGLLQLLGRLRE
jgi:Ni,Fe-hydrogenase III small subunit/Pyruvate/2-oxoacid:ferredoxin oxidoreductase delta subunit